MWTIFCRHKWTEIATGTIEDRVVTYWYGCVKCAKVKEMSDGYRVGWLFKQQHKGAMVDDD